MSYHIYHTDGFVLGGMDTGEDSRLVRIYTRELGLVFAKAQGARKLQSKHRYHLQDFAYGKYAFVRGREIWRIVGADCSDNLFEFTHDPEKFKTLVKVLRLLGRLSPEEDAHSTSSNFFNEFFLAASFLANEDLNEEEQKSFETLLAVKMLDHHGYWKNEADDEYLHERDFTREALAEIAPKRRKLNERVHRSLEYSHL